MSSPACTHHIRGLQNFGTPPHARGYQVQTTILPFVVLQLSMACSMAWAIASDAGAGAGALAPEGPSVSPGELPGFMPGCGRLVRGALRLRCFAGEGFAARILATQASPWRTAGVVRKVHLVGMGVIWREYRCGGFRLLPLRSLSELRVGRHQWSARSTRLKRG